MKDELTTVPRPPANTGWRSQNQSRVEPAWSGFLSERWMESVYVRTRVCVCVTKRDRTREGSSFQLFMQSYHRVTQGQRTLAAIPVRVVTRGTWQTACLYHRIIQTRLRLNTHIAHDMHSRVLWCPCTSGGGVVAHTHTHNMAADCTMCVDENLSRGSRAKGWISHLRTPGVK